MIMWKQRREYAQLKIYKRAKSLTNSNLSVQFPVINSLPSLNMYTRLSYFMNTYNNGNY